MIVLSSCGLNNKATQTQGALTVTGIHEEVVYGQTTSEQLIKLYGKPNQQTADQEMISELYNQDNDIEEGTMERLSEHTDYFETEKFTKISYSEGNTYDACYTYTSKELGLDHVRFYIKDNIVRTSMFGSITNRPIAKQDKYLRQIMD